MKESSYLVQRLSQPYRGPVDTLVGKLAAANPFAFGGGYRNGGLTDEAMALLRDIFLFDYMGSAEYEFGAVPKALQVIAKQAEAGELVAGTFEIPISQVKPDFREPKGYKPPKNVKVTVFYLCHKDWPDELENRVRAMAKEGYGYRSKEATMVDRVLRPAPNPTAYRSEVCGWLELDNGYFFFTDVEMWTKTAALFGVDTTAQAHLEETS